eukprot:gnl/TRDRNA2_/TRDRNA2_143325_c0_seq2.p1 gnl/TRDRNA2_/TRDRNA2_143325_c0~~gnl/TRDRNA2_/TRDRNA2_143325_c0_seq2.p1  ORF type:complete len:319 (+),score=30.28 gnl/TRDRNA2_/TRDRNA2_143325_c0_seq2:121-1077(+)
MAARCCFDDEGTDEVFRNARSQGIAPFFAQLRFRTDGPVLKPGLESVLFSNTRVFNALSMLVFVGFNLFTVISNWWSTYEGWSRDDNTKRSGFVPIGSLNWKDDHKLLHCIIFSVSSAELLVMLCMAFEVVSILLVHLHYIRGSCRGASRLCCSHSGNPLDHYRPWYRFFHALCHTLRVMSNFSAMKTLEFLNPQVLYQEAELELTTARSTACAMLFFLTTRLVLGLIGFAAFLVKFSNIVDTLNELREPLEGGDKRRTPGYQVQQTLVLLGFCNQIFGITQLWRVQERRLLLFLFRWIRRHATEERGGAGQITGACR